MAMFGGLCLLLYLTALCANADLFTSMADLQRLLQMEKDIPHVIDDYITAENARLDELRRFEIQILLAFQSFLVWSRSTEPKIRTFIKTWRVYRIPSMLFE